MRRRLGSTTVAAGFPQGKSSKFPMGKIPKGQYNSRKKEKFDMCEHYFWRQVIVVFFNGRHYATHCSRQCGLINFEVTIPMSSVVLELLLSLA